MEPSMGAPHYAAPHGGSRAGSVGASRPDKNVASIGAVPRLPEKQPNPDPRAKNPNSKSTRGVDRLMADLTEYACRCLPSLFVGVGSPHAQTNQNLVAILKANKSPPLSPINPPPALSAFISRLIKRTQLSHSTLVHALLLCHKLHSRNPLLRTTSLEYSACFVSNSKNNSSMSAQFDPALYFNNPWLCHKIFLGALIVSAKVLYDDTYDNAAWSSVSQGICASVADVNRLEACVLGCLDFDAGAHVSRREWLAFCSFVGARVTNSSEDDAAEAATVASREDHDGRRESNVTDSTAYSRTSSEASLLTSPTSSTSGSGSMNSAFKHNLQKLSNLAAWTRTVQSPPSFLPWRKRTSSANTDLHKHSEQLSSASTSSSSSSLNIAHQSCNQNSAGPLNLNSTDTLSSFEDYQPPYPAGIAQLPLRQPSTAPKSILIPQPHHSEPRSLALQLIHADNTTLVFGSDYLAGTNTDRVMLTSYEEKRDEVNALVAGYRESVLSANVPPEQEEFVRWEEWKRCSPLYRLQAEKLRVIALASAANGSVRPSDPLAFFSRQQQQQQPRVSIPSYEQQRSATRYTEGLSGTIGMDSAVELQHDGRLMRSSEFVKQQHQHQQQLQHQHEMQQVYSNGTTAENSRENSAKVGGGRGGRNAFVREGCDHDGNGECKRGSDSGAWGYGSGSAGFEVLGMSGGRGLGGGGGVGGGSEVAAEMGRSGGNRNLESSLFLESMMSSGTVLEEGVAGCDFEDDGFQFVDSVSGGRNGTDVSLSSDGTVFPWSGAGRLKTRLYMPQHLPHSRGTSGGTVGAGLLAGFGASALSCLDENGDDSGDQDECDEESLIHDEGICFAGVGGVTGGGGLTDDLLSYNPTISSECESAAALSETTTSDSSVRQHFELFELSRTLSGVSLADAVARDVNEFEGSLYSPWLDH
ncbi:hypothetical protein HDU77_011081 [Chytriomyces hyalinus]|nr:hypothetical protein HDU77_011081 [Chytriomyces hyalinus]